MSEQNGEQPDGRDAFEAMQRLSQVAESWPKHTSIAIGTGEQVAADGMKYPTVLFVAVMDPATALLVAGWMKDQAVQQLEAGPQQGPRPSGLVLPGAEQVVAADPGAMAAVQDPKAAEQLRRAVKGE